MSTIGSGASEGTIPGVRACVSFAVLMLFAGALQATLSPVLLVQGGQPDFPLTLALVAAFLSDASVGAVGGLWAGLVTASVVGQTTGTYLVTRALAGWLAGATTARLFRGNLGVVLLGTFLATLGAELLYGLSVPRQTLVHGVDWCRAVFIGAVYNTLFALPLTLLLRRLGWGTRR